MKQIDEKTWWKYLDGDCSEEEKLQLESLLKEDEAMAAELLLAKTLHEELSLLQLETPSLDFTTNVMAALPEKRTITPTEPLLSKKMMWFFISSTSIIFVALLLAPSIMGAPSAAKPVVASQPIMDGLGSILTSLITFIESNAPALPQFTMPNISPSVWMFSLVLILGIGSLMLVDSLLGKRIYSKRLGV